MASGATVQFGSVTIRGSHVFANSGTATWPTGSFCLGEGAVFNNSGSFAAQADGYQLYN